MKKLFALVLAMVLAFTLVACGAAPASSTAASSAAASTAEPASETPTLDAIKASGKIVMMTNANFAPFEYLGEDGKPAGADIDLAQMVADELGVELEIMDMDFGLLVEALKSGKGDFVAAGMDASEERKEQIDFSMSYTKNGLVLVVPADSDITSADQIKDKKIAVQEGTTSHMYVVEELGQEPMAFKSPVEAGQAVASGKADLAIIDNLPAKGIVKAMDGKLKALDSFLSEENVSMGVAKGKEDLVNFINSVLEKAVADGTVEKIIDKHYAIANEG